MWYHTTVLTALLYFSIKHSPVFYAIVLLINTSLSRKINQMEKKSHIFSTLKEAHATF